MPSHRSSRSSRHRSRSRSRSRGHRSRRSHSRGRREKKSSGGFTDAPASVASIVQQQSSVLQAANPQQAIQQVSQLNQMAADDAAATKIARELYVGNLPPGITGHQLKEFLGAVIVQMGANIHPGNPIVSSWLSTTNNFAFVQFRSIEETDNVMMLDGCQLMGQVLKIGRPKGYTGDPRVNVSQPPTAASMGGTNVAVQNAVQAINAGAPAAAAVPAPEIITGPNYFLLRMRNFPEAATESQIKVICEAIGALKRFEVMPESTGLRVCLFEYLDHSFTQNAIQGLNGLDLVGQSVIVELVNKKAEEGAAEKSQCVVLKNICTLEELKDDKDFEEIKEDIAEECSKFGSVKSIFIPRPSHDGTEVAGLLNVYLEMGNGVEAGAVVNSLGGKSFGGQPVQADHFPLEHYNEHRFY